MAIDVYRVTETNVIFRHELGGHFFRFYRWDGTHLINESTGVDIKPVTRVYAECMDVLSRL